MSPKSMSSNFSAALRCMPGITWLYRSRVMVIVEWQCLHHLGAQLHEPHPEPTDRRSVGVGHLAQLIQRDDAPVQVVHHHFELGGDSGALPHEPLVMSVGYHADAATLAPNGWITGSVWNWDALYTNGRHHSDRKVAG